MALLVCRLLGVEPLFGAPMASRCPPGGVAARPPGRPATRVVAVVRRRGVLAGAAAGGVGAAGLAWASGAGWARPANPERGGHRTG